MFQMQKKKILKTEDVKEISEPLIKMGYFKPLLEALNIPLFQMIEPPRSKHM